MDSAPDQWPAFLDVECGDNPELRVRVDQLLQAHQVLGSIHGGVESPMATIDSPSVTERRGTQIGPYQLLQQIGEGGMGVVYMAEQTRPVQRAGAFRGNPRTLGRTLGVLGDQRHVRIVEVEQRELGRLLQRLGHRGRRARGADRQQHRDLDGAGRAGDAGGAGPIPPPPGAPQAAQANGNRQAREDEPERAKSTAMLTGSRMAPLFQAVRRCRARLGSLAIVVMANSITQVLSRFAPQAKLARNHGPNVMDGDATISRNVFAPCRP